MVRRYRGRRIRRRNGIKNKYSFKVWKRKYSANARKMEEAEQNYIADYGRW